MAVVPKCPLFGELTVDYQDEVLAVIKVVQEIPGYGEQKVCMC